MAQGKYVDFQLTNPDKVLRTLATPVAGRWEPLLASLLVPQLVLGNYKAGDPYEQIIQQISISLI